MSYKEKELVIVNSSGETLLIDARLLHRQLQVSTKFTTWITRRIEEFGFDENQDFFPILGKTSFLGGRKPNEYHLTMDMAKELAMMERNEVGRQVRRYFIAVEKEARETAGSARMLPKGIHSRQINGRKVYPYLRLAQKMGYKAGGSLYARRYRYPNHFIKLDNLWYCTEEMANLLTMWKSTVNHRESIRDMQPILPPGFGDPLTLGGLL